MRVILVLFMCAHVVYGVQDSSRHIRTYTTYYGDLGKDFVNDVCVDKDNNRIIVGTTQSTKSISTKGAFQESSNGLIDGFISKWSITGELIWATYFGGEYDDYIHGVASDNHGNIYVAGRTTSQKNIATKNALRTQIGGSTDAFLAKFNAKGELIWSTYWGGSQIDAIERVAVSRNGKIAVVGGTFSDNGISTNNAHQTVKGRGDDGFVTVFNPDGSIYWSTYYGGADSDAVRDVSFNEEGEILVTGQSDSKSMIATIQSHQRNHAGNLDAFIAKFDSTGKRLWGTYIGGTADDFGMGIDCDENGMIYVNGNTKSSTGIATSGAYDTTLSGGIRDIALWKFSPKGKLLWGTYYGGVSHDYIYNIDYSNGRLLMTGYSMNEGFSYKTNVQDSLQSVLDGIIIEFDTAGDLFHSTYLGGQMNDFVTGAVYDNLGQIVFAGNTLSPKGISTANGHQITKSMNEDAMWGVIGSRIGFVNVSSCDSYSWQDSSYLTSGIYSKTVDQNGSSDSLVVLNLTVLNPSYSDVSIQACAPFMWKGKYIEQNGVYLDTLNGQANNGCDSIVRLNAELFSPKLTKLSAIVCGKYYWPNKGIDLVESGVYRDTIIGFQGCDSIIELDLKIHKLVARATVSGQTLSASSGESYQWLDCDLDFKPLLGATSATFNPTYTGFYAVEIKQGNCIDTSDCVYIEVETNEIDVSDGRFQVFPNPINEDKRIHIVPRHKFSKFELRDFYGSLIGRGKIVADEIDLSQYSSGIFLLQLLTENRRGKYCMKIILP